MIEHGKNTVRLLYSIMYSFKWWQNNKNHAFPSKLCIRNEKPRLIVTHFTMKIIRTYLYITCNKEILFSLYFLAYCGYSLYSPFFLFLRWSVMKMISQWLWWGDEVEGWCDAVMGYWPSDETGEGSSRSSSECGEGWADENEYGWMRSGADDVDGWGSSIVDTFFSPTCGRSSL